jgi:acetyl-CoA carboxylase biotin carboxyl carrier protein
MQFSDVRKLVKLVESSEIHELEFEQEGSKIVIRKADPNVQAPAAPDAAEQAKKANYHEVKSPMVGTLYRSPAPDADPYVQVGDKVKAGDVLCIVEAMKLMNEIECDVSGRVVDIQAENAQPVEFGQVLFLVDPNG